MLGARKRVTFNGADSVKRSAFDLGGLVEAPPRGSLSRNMGERLLVGTGRGAGEREDVNEMRQIVVADRAGGPRTGVVFLAAVFLAFLVTQVASGAPSPPRIAHIAAGGINTCALTTAGGVKCWGYNVQCQLGNGTKVHGSNTPVDVKGLMSGVRAIAEGSGHGCALTSRGAVRCWGWNNLGQLGNGAATYQSNVPVDVKGLGSSVTAIAAGWTHTCALTSAGGVKCWGSNGTGQLGTGSVTPSRTPVDVRGLASGVRAIAAGGGQTCALTTVGGVKCWGLYPGNGGRSSFVHTPVDVAGLASGVTAIGAGNRHTCAVASGGGLKCWGDGFSGKLCDGSTAHRLAPVDVVGLASGVKAVTAGQAHTCALTTAGGVKCWGFNRDGQLGNGSMADQGPTTPVDVVGLRSGVVAISAGQAHTCALMARGGVKCWGNNGTGQLGNGSQSRDSARPVDVRFSTPPAKTAPTVPPATATLRTFVDRIAAVLAQSASGRRELASAITAGLNCSISPRAAAQRVDRVVANRRSLLARLRSVAAPSAQATEALRLLRLGLEHSITADIRYRDGFLALGARRCPLPTNRHFTLARQSDTRASAAKRSFVAVYSPLAKRVNRRTWSANEI